MIFICTRLGHVLYICCDALTLLALYAATLSKNLYYMLSLISLTRLLYIENLRKEKVQSKENVGTSDREDIMIPEQVLQKLRTDAVCSREVTVY